jgi:hypothetical protein
MARDIKYISPESGNIDYIVDYQVFKWQHEKLQLATLLIVNYLSGNIPQSQRKWTRHGDDNTVNSSGFVDTI